MPQSHHHHHHHHQSHQSNDFNFPPQALHLAEHSNSSNETLVGTAETTASHFGSNDSIPGSLIHQQRQSYHSQQTASIVPPQPPPTTIGDQDKKIFFDRTSSEDLGLLTLRSSSDPTISLNCLQSRQQPTQPQPQSSDSALTDISQNLQTPSAQSTSQLAANAANLLDPQSILPSFQETYSIKYNQLASFGLKMDEECYNIAAAQHHADINYHAHGHGHAHAHGHQHTHMQHPHQYDYQPNTSQFASPSFYPYEQQQSMVSAFGLLSPSRSRYQIYIFLLTFLHFNSMDR